MREFDRCQILSCDQDFLTRLGNVEQAFGEGGRHTNAAVRCRIARERTRMKRDARPGQPLHERHRCIVIDVRAMMPLFFEDTENPSGRRKSFAPRGDRRTRHDTACAVKRETLSAERDDGKMRTGRNRFGFGVVRTGATGFSPRCVRVRKGCDETDRNTNGYSNG